MQKMIANKISNAKLEIERHLEAGWTVVPGTTVISAIEYSPEIGNEPYSLKKTDRGTYFETYLSVVIQRDTNSE